MKPSTRMLAAGHLLRRAMLVGVVTLALAGAGLVAPANAQAPSLGCAAMNNALLDATYQGGTVSGPFEAGEKLTVSAGPPTEGTPPMNIDLQVDAFVVDSAPFPGTVEYVIPTSGNHTVIWTHDGVGNVTWRVSCEPAPAAPSCNGQAATIYVDAQGVIVGGPNSGQPYRGKLNGTAGNDVIVGTSGPDEIAARAGNDLVCAGDGDDEIEAGAGNDRIFGEGGNDDMSGGGGNDEMTGGLGADKFRGGTGTDTATDFSPAEGDTKRGVEHP